MIFYRLGWGFRGVRQVAEIASCLIAACILESSHVSFNSKSDIIEFWAHDSRPETRTPNPKDKHIIKAWNLLIFLFFFVSSFLFARSLNLLVLFLFPPCPSNGQILINPTNRNLKPNNYLYNQFSLNLYEILAASLTRIPHFSIPLTLNPKPWLNPDWTLNYNSSNSVIRFLCITENIIA